MEQAPLPRDRRLARLGFRVSIVTAALTAITFALAVSTPPLQPSLLAGETEGLPLLTQYNPHGLFIALEELGYLLWAVSFLALAPVVGGRGPERAVRWVWTAGALAVLAGLVAFGLTLGHARGYLFEVMAISVDWAVLLVTSTLMAIVFRRAPRPA